MAILLRLGIEDKAILEKFDRRGEVIVTLQAIVATAGVAPYQCVLPVELQARPYEVQSGNFTCRCIPKSPLNNMAPSLYLC